MSFRTSLAIAVVSMLILPADTQAEPQAASEPTARPALNDSREPTPGAMRTSAKRTDVLYCAACLLNIVEVPRRRAASEYCRGARNNADQAKASA